MIFVFNIMALLLNVDMKYAMNVTIYTQYSKTWFPVLLICGIKEKYIKYPMHRIS